MRRLNVYYDNPNEASDMYLKYLKKDCEANDIEVVTFDNIDDWMTKSSGAELILEPTKTLVPYTEYNVDRPSATAQGIYNHITKCYPERKTVVAVIGRGLVGKQLINMLIDYGYTVFEFNSKSNDLMLLTCEWFANVVVGLATEQVANKVKSCYLNEENIELIDSGNNFDTKNKLRCGKWTREVIIDRIKEMDSTSL